MGLLLFAILGQLDVWADANIHLVIENPAEFYSRLEDFVVEMVSKGFREGVRTMQLKQPSEN